ncbi:hypothetical protein DFH09DRAFT_1109497 [Mycena vulgaris]|nr:hypothetical protein DFH09DRAFT_1109497 [Mycena vulgaris]
MESVDVNAQVSGCCFDRGSQRRNSSTEAMALTRPKTDADRQRTDVFRTVSRQRRQIWDSSSGGEWGVGQGVRIGWSGRQWINIFASVFAVRESRGYTIESGMALRRSRSAVMSFIAVSFRRIQATTSGEGLTERGQTSCDLAGTSTICIWRPSAASAGKTDKTATFGFSRLCGSKSSNCSKRGKVSDISRREYSILSTAWAMVRQAISGGQQQSDERRHVNGCRRMRRHNQGDVGRRTQGAQQEVLNGGDVDGIDSVKCEFQQPRSNEVALDGTEVVGF